MKDLIVILFLLLIFLLFPFLWVSYKLRRGYSLRVNGFWVCADGRDSIRYEERHDNSVGHLKIYRQLCVGGPIALYVPTAEQWREEMPEWAKDRRDEIIERTKRLLGKHYELVYSDEDS